MPQKNDLSSLKEDKRTEGILPSYQTQDEVQVLEKQKRVGRPPKKPNERRTYKVTISLTEFEGEIVKEKSGLVNEATFLYSLLKESGLFEDN